MLAFKRLTVAERVAQAARDVSVRLIAVRQHGDSAFLNLPMVYPGGGFVTVRIDATQDGFRVSDNGFAFRELESFGAERSFPNTARNIADREALEVNRRAVFVEVPEDQLLGAVCDIGAASWKIADDIIGRISTEESDVSEIEEHLRERLSVVFGSSSVHPNHKLVGSSSNEWAVSAVVRLPDRNAVFHAVGTHPNSIFRTSTAFHDLAALEHAPALIAVVKNKAELGSKLGLLSQAGRVIEDGQPDDVYRRAAA